MRVSIIFLLSAFLCQCSPFLREMSHEEAGIPVVFNYMDAQARKVCIAGNFNQWSSQSDCLLKNRSLWTLKLSLPPGRYQYLFLIDGRIWKLDPGAPLTEDNGFGTKNSVLIVEE